MKCYKGLVSLLFIGVLLFMGGCGNNIQNLTEEQIAKIGNYSAGILLKYDAQSRSRLVSDLEIEKYDERQARLEELRKQQEEIKKNQPENEEESENRPDDSVETVPVHYDQLSDFFILPEGVNLVYAGYAVQDMYPEEPDAYAPIECSEGKKLLVLSFLLANNSEQSVSLDFFGLKSSYKITVNNRYTKGIFSTILMEDLATYIGDIEPGQTEKLVLLTEMDEGHLQDIQSITLKIKNVSDEYTIRLN